MDGLALGAVGWRGHERPAVSIFWLNAAA